MRKLFSLLAGFVLFIGTTQAQNRTISGKVTDGSGNPIPKASVAIKGSDGGTSTDNNGTFKISVPNTAKFLIVSSVGYGVSETNIVNKSSVEINLFSTESNIQEVVVVGYGTQKRTETTGSLSSVKGSVIAQKPVQSFETALAGKAAGVQITNQGGLLNSPPVVRIRGTNSISLSSSPLYVVDGVPSFSGDQSGTSAPSNALASINPNDIESIDIAKDAAAAAIYGSRAANGVVFITTKRGKSGKAKVNYDGWVGFTTPTRMPQVLNAQQYVDYKNLALNNLKALVPSTTGQFIRVNDANGVPIDTKWQDEVYNKQGFSHSNSLSVSGGNDGTTYFMSAGFTDQEAILQKNKFTRANILINVDTRVSKIFSLGGKIAYSNEKNLIAGNSGSLPGEAFASAGGGRLAVALPSNVSPFMNDGTGRYNIASGTAIGGQGNLVNGTNPFTFNNIRMLMDLNRSNNEVNRIQGNFYVQLKPTKWLTLKSIYGIDNNLIDNDVFYNPFHGDGFGTGIGPGGAATSSFTKDKTWIWTNTAQADFKIGQDHNFSLLVGNEQQRQTFLGYGINRRTLSDSAYTVIQAGFTTNNSSSMALSENYLLSTFGRINYNYQGKYFVSANLRQDEHSALGEKKGLFYGFSGGWEITKEKFWITSGLSKVFSSFKLRGSYGQVGNIAGIGSYPTFSQYGSGLYGGLATLAFSSVGNNKITWETSKKTDFGFSFGILKEKVTGEIAFYKNNIDGLVLNVPQSPSTGLGSLLQNVGQMYNKGVEITLNANPIQTKNFSWNTSLTFSSNENMVVSLADGLTDIRTANSLETTSITLPGYSVGQVYVVRTDGVNPANGQRVYLNQAGNKVQYTHILPTGTPSTVNKFTNLDGTNYQKNGVNATINSADDAVVYANTVPKYTGGWDNTFTYKNIDINFLFTYQLGYSIYYGSYAGMRDQRFWNNDVAVLRYWQKPGDITDMPKPIFGDNVSNGSATPSDVNVFSGDFVKLRTINIGYSLPNSLLSKLNISRARIYMSAQNVAVFTKYIGPDPEVSGTGNSNTSQGVDRNGLGNGRTITFGLNINF